MGRQSEEKKFTVTYSYSFETNGKGKKELHKIEKKLKTHMFESLSDVCPAQRRLLDEENDGVPDGLFEIRWLVSLNTDLISGSCEPELDANNTCTVYDGEITMMTSDDVDEILAVGRIMQYLTAYVESDEYESVEGVLSMRMVEDSDEKAEQASDATMSLEEQSGASVSMGTLLGVTTAVAALSAVLFGIVAIKRKREAAQHLQLK